MDPVGPTPQQVRRAKAAAQFRTLRLKHGKNWRAEDQSYGKNLRGFVYLEHKSGHTTIHQQTLVAWERRGWLVRTAPRRWKVTQEGLEAARE